MAAADERHWHYLRPLTGCKCPAYLAFLDTQSWDVSDPKRIGGLEHQFRLATLITGRWVKGRLTQRKVCHCDSPADLWAAFGRAVLPGHTLWLFAHRLGFHLTASGFWTRVEDGTFQWHYRKLKDGQEDGREEPQWVDRHGYVVLNDPPVILSGWYAGCRVVLLDWANYYREPMAELRQLLGMRPLPEPAAEWNSDHWHERSESIAGTVESSVASTLTTWQSGSCGPWGPTASSLAWNYFRRRHLAERQILVHGNEAALWLERAGYYGGQLVTGWVGEVTDDGGRDGEIIGQNEDELWVRDGRVYVADVNSLYPWAMRDRPMPTRLCGVYDGELVRKVLLERPDRVGIALVLLNCGDCDYPVRVSPRTLEPMLVDGAMPIEWDRRMMPRTVYAGGAYWTVLAGDELLSALHLGHILEIRLGSLYLAERPFAGLVDELWDRKEKAEEDNCPAARRFWKLLLNALIGRWGMHSHGWEDCPNVPPLTLWGHWIARNVETGERVTYRSLGGNVQIQREREEGGDSCPAIAACITAAARHRMRMLRQLAGRDNVYYQDTDSLHLTREGYDRLNEAGEIRPAQLGRLKLESVARAALYLGQKSYRLEDTWVVSGIVSGAKREGRSSWRQREFARLTSILASDPAGGATSHETTKANSGHGLTGKLSGSGFVNPFRLYHV